MSSGYPTFDFQKFYWSTTRTDYFTTMGKKSLHAIYRLFGYGGWNEERICCLSKISISQSAYTLCWYGEMVFENSTFDDRTKNNVRIFEIFYYFHLRMIEKRMISEILLDAVITFHGNTCVQSQRDPCEEYEEWFHWLIKWCQSHLSSTVNQLSLCSCDCIK